MRGTFASNPSSILSSFPSRPHPAPDRAFHWTGDPDARIERFKLPADSPEFQQVEASVRRKGASAGPIQILEMEIERLQLPHMWRSYATFRRNILLREHVKDQHGADRFERRTVFHGTDEDTVPKILASGFRRDYAGKNGALDAELRTPCMLMSDLHALPTRMVESRLYSRGVW